MVKELGLEYVLSMLYRSFYYFPPILTLLFSHSPVWSDSPTSLRIWTPGNQAKDTAFTTSS